MDIKSWILLVGTVLIVAVICHGFWTAYRARKNDVRMEIESEIPQDDLDEMVLLRGELPNGGARVTPTVGFEALRIKKRNVVDTPDDNLDLPIDEVAAFAEEGVFDSAGDEPESLADEGNFDAGYEPEQTSLDLALDGQSNALEERYAERIAAARTGLQGSGVTGGDEVAATTAALSSAAGGKKAPLLVDAANTPLGGRPADVPSPLPRKKLIAPEDQPPARKQFEPPYPDEIAAQELAQARAKERAEEEARVAARVKAEERAEELARLAQERRERELAEQKAAAELQAAAEKKAAAVKRAAAQKKREQEQARVAAEQAREERVRIEARKAVDTPEQPQLAFAQDEAVRATQSKAKKAQSPEADQANEELVVLNVIAKTSAFHGGDVLELFLRNGIKFGDMNIFHRIDPVTKASQYSIASLTEPGYFDLRTMDSQLIRGLCLFMQLPGAGQPTKVFTDMLTVADKLARQLDAEVCDEQFNRLTRQSTEHYRQRVAEYTRRQMAQRVLV